MVAALFLIATGVLLVTRRDRHGDVAAPAPASATTATEAGAVQPLISTTGDDFGHIWRQIEVLEAWLLVHPDPAVASQIYEPGTPAYQDLVDLLGQLERDGQGLRIEGYKVLEVNEQERPTPDEVVLSYTDRYTAKVTVDASGSLVADEPSDGLVRQWRLVLHRGGDGHWRAAENTLIATVPPTTTG